MLNDMLADMFKKALPPEVMAMLSPEKITELGEKVTAFITDVRERLDRIEEKQIQIIGMLATEAENGPGKSSGKRSGNASGSDSGSNGNGTD
jgi:hypothetical protein